VTYVQSDYMKESGHAMRANVVQTAKLTV